MRRDQNQHLGVDPGLWKDYPLVKKARFRGVGEKGMKLGCVFERLDDKQ